MRKLGKFVSPVLPVSMGIFVIVFALSGPVGPCGPSGSWGIVYFVGYPIGFIGILVGLVLSAKKTLKYLETPYEDKKPDKEN
jgi:hypothetical protein